MATDLHDRLRDLAARTPSASPPANLWDRGLRRHRATQVGRAVAAVVLVALVGVGGWTWHETRPVEPADTHGSAHVPDRFFYHLSPWTAGFDGPPGPLVTVLPSQRKTVFGSDEGLVGVTASSGTYGFLDLPGDAALSPTLDAQFAISPDGRRLAFWTTGAPSGAPNTVLENGLTLTGVATYDTVTGQVRRTHLTTGHGIASRLLLWADNDTLLFGYAQILGRDGSENETTSHVAGTEVWDQPSGSPTLLPTDSLPTFADNFSTRATTGLVVSGSLSRTWWVLDPQQPARRVFRTDQQADLLVPSPDHRRVAAVPEQQNSNGGPLVIAALPGPGSHATVKFRTILDGQDWYRPLVWTDSDHVAALRGIEVHDPDGGPHIAGRIDLVDVRTGSSRPLVAEWGTHGTNDSDTWLASGLLGAPVVHAHPPPTPTSPRLLLGICGVGLLVALFLWRATRGRRA